MREILFRGKSIDIREWVHGSLVVHDQLECSIIDYANYENESYNWHDVIPETVSQFTGLLDKNGVKIFEGDLLHTAGYYCEVKFIDGMFCSVYNHPEDGETLPLVDLSPERFEIIGNIYED